MPVFFYIDPEFATDPKMKGINIITLRWAPGRGRRPGVEAGVWVCMCRRACAIVPMGGHAHHSTCASPSHHGTVAHSSACPCCSYTFFKTEEEDWEEEGQPAAVGAIAALPAAATAGH